MDTKCACPIASGRQRLLGCKPVSGNAGSSIGNRGLKMRGNLLYGAKRRGHAHGNFSVVSLWSILNRCVCKRFAVRLVRPNGRSEFPVAEFVSRSDS